MSKEEILKLLEKYGVYYMTNVSNGETIVDITSFALFGDEFDESLLLFIDRDGKISFQTGEL
jgi:hypothetical protein